MTKDNTTYEHWLAYVQLKVRLAVKIVPPDEELIQQAYADGVDADVYGNTIIDKYKPAKKA